MITERYNKKKNRVWEDLSEEFNSQSGVSKRDSRQLKKCWENIKSRAKKQIKIKYLRPQRKYNCCLGEMTVINV